MDLFTLVGSISIEIQDAMTNIESVIGKVNELEGLLNGTQTTTQQTGQVVTDTTEKTTKNTSSTLNKWSVMMGNLYTQFANKMYGFGKSFMQTGFEFNANMEKWEASFKTHLGGSEEAASSFMQRLRQFAIDTPLSMQDVVEEARNLFGAGFNAEDIIPALWQIGDLSKGDSAIFTRVARAYWQGIGKPHLNMQDANQMVEVGVPIWQIIADYFNATAREGKTDWTKDFVSNLGTWNKEIPKFPHEMVTNEEFRAAIAMATSEQGDFYNAMFNLMDTEYGAAQKMLDQYEQTAGVFVASFFEVFKSDILPALTEFFNQLNDLLVKNPEALTMLAEAIGYLATTGLDLLMKGLTSLIDIWAANKPKLEAMGLIEGDGNVQGIYDENGVSHLGPITLVDPAAMDELMQEYNVLHGEDRGGGFKFGDSDKHGESDDEGFSLWRLLFPRKDDGLLTNLFFNNDKDSIGGSSLSWIDDVLREMNNGRNTGRFEAPSVDFGGGDFASIPALIAAIQALTAENQSAPDKVAAAIVDGMSGITVENNITTGDVLLNGVAVGRQIAPTINTVLGGMARTSNRWG